MKIFPNDVVSDSYKNERQLATWEYEEKLNIIRNNKK
jgi:hypothetical protein